MPDFPIVDTHLHLWDPSAGHISYPWLESVLSLNRPFLLEDYNQHCGPVQVEKMVFLQCDPIPEDDAKEVEWVTELSREEPRIQGIVAGGALEKGDGIRPYLESLQANPLVKGIRRLIQSEGIDFCVLPGFVKGVQLLPEYGFSFDICIYHPQMGNAVELVRQCPEVSFILDHIGKPNIKGRELDPWRQEIRTLAKFENVCCKISGVATEADHPNWTREDLKPYIDHVIESFGFDRVIYGGDWPVATQAIQYPEWVAVLEWAVSGCSEAELRKLFRDNAIEFFRLSQ